jgi:hypothetical protein
MRMQFMGMPDAEALAAIRLFGEEVLPQLAAESIPAGR